MSFGSPAADYVENKLDLNRFIARHPISTYYLRMDNDRLCPEGINKGDILVVDRSLTPRERQLVVGETDREFKVLHFSPWQAAQAAEMMVWGVVTAVIRKLH